LGDVETLKAEQENFKSSVTEWGVWGDLPRVLANYKTASFVFDKSRA
jgi:hypothetical protein